MSRRTALAGDRVGRDGICWTGSVCLRAGGRRGRLRYGQLEPAGLMQAGHEGGSTYGFNSEMVGVSTSTAVGS